MDIIYEWDIVHCQVTLPNATPNPPFESATDVKNLLF